MRQRLIIVTLIFFEGTQVSSIMEGLFVNKENYIVKTKDGTKDDWAKVILKVKKPSPYSVMVIANSSKSFAGCQSENNIKDIIQDDKDALVKVWGKWISVLILTLLAIQQLRRHWESL